MSYLKQSIYIVLIFVLLWFGYRYLNQTHTKIPNQINAQTFDSLLTNVHWVEFNEQGEINQEFFSPEVKSIPLKHLYHIKTPRLRLSENQESWEICSRYAHVSQNKETIDLKKNVFIKHFSQTNTRISIMKTDSLRYLPNLKKAETLNLVTIALGENIIRSHGLEAYFDNHKKIKLGKTHAHYFPQTEKKPTNN